MTDVVTAIGRHLPNENVVLVCAKGHEHVVGWPQVESVMRDACAWDHLPLRVAGYKLGGRLVREATEKGLPWPPDGLSSSQATSGR